MLTSPDATTRHATRDEQRRAERERYAHRSQLPELRRNDLRSDRFAIVHQPTGDEFKIYAGAIEVGPTHPISAFYYDSTGAVVFLERIGRL